MASAPTSPRNDPLRQSRFWLEIDNIAQAGFSEVTIPDKSAPPIEYREGTDPFQTVRKYHGLIANANITCKWGITNSMDLYNWFKDVEEGKLKFSQIRKNITIILMNEIGEEAARWTFRDAWPTKYDAPDLNAKGNEIAIETLEIAHEGMIRVR